MVALMEPPVPGEGVFLFGSGAVEGMLGKVGVLHRFRNKFIFTRF
jgi:hypothetical protein